MITCRSLCTEDKCSWIEVHLRVKFDLIVQIDNVKDVQKLTLVLVKSLNLNVKDRTRINFNAVMLQNCLLYTSLCRTEKQYSLPYSKRK